MIDKQQKRELESLIIETVQNSGILADFRKERTVATPIESYSITNRRYVNLNGNVADRPRSSVATVGQHYFAIDTFIPMTFDGNDWRNGVGSVVAVGRNV